ncbi:MAG TPA: class I SAM-dependent methyltransferase [Mycobacteriales bacterium]|jgi:2-polyprenyl-3-methyl-5-hydroxy-6-metoxy-1,4-benzoquinol methylase|nr:class I SAM-dependent methyltransferase [Mycobacteriales bacterium]
MTRDAADDWDAQAESFDEQPDHGLLDPDVRRAWRDLLLPLMPPAPASLLDVGCGTGTLSVLLAQAGYAVTGVDSSRRMVAAARRKAQLAGVTVGFVIGDASDPAVSSSAFDVALCRHVLWALPDPAAAINRWNELLSPDGRLVLVEGQRSTGTGLTAAQARSLVLRSRQEAETSRLDDPGLWGGPIADERYVVVSRR